MRRGVQRINSFHHLIERLVRNQSRDGQTQFGFDLSIGDGNLSAFEFETADETYAHVASGSMAFDDNKLQNIAAYVSNDFVIGNLRCSEGFFRDDLLRDNFDNPNFLPGTTLTARSRG